MSRENIDRATVEGFGHEWSRFDQAALSDDEARAIFEQYFAIFPWDDVGPSSVGFDMGCGSGRWAQLVAPRVGTLHCVDASREALAVAASNLKDLPNCRLHHASVDDSPLEPRSMDFGYSLGVLHHLPDTAAGLRACTELLKSGAPFLVYLYYAFDNRPLWFRALWRISDVVRRVISRAPFWLRLGVSGVIATFIYLPLSRIARLMEKRIDVEGFPLSFYRHRSFYTMRTDALDRFGTRLERRFRRDEIESMMRSAGLIDIRFSENAPFWCAEGIKS